MYLIDTNIFLEILLKQDKSDLCKAILNKNIAELNISDFTLHSIGIILFKQCEPTPIFPKLFNFFKENTHLFYRFKNNGMHRILKSYIEFL